MDGNDSELDLRIDKALENDADPFDQHAARRIAAGTWSRIGRWRDRRRRMRFFALAGALSFACALAVVLLLPLPARSTAARLAPPAIRYTPGESNPAPVAMRKTAFRGRAAVLKVVPAPKLEQLPAPSPLSAEEQAMVAFASRTRLTPQEAKQLKPPSAKPLQIPALETDALQIAALQSKPIAIAP